MTDFSRFDYLFDSWVSLYWISSLGSCASRSWLSSWRLSKACPGLNDCHSSEGGCFATVSSGRRHFAFHLILPKIPLIFPSLCWKLIKSISALRSWRSSAGNPGSDLGSFSCTARKSSVAISCRSSKIFLAHDFTIITMPVFRNF